MEEKKRGEFLIAMFDTRGVDAPEKGLVNSTVCHGRWMTDPRGKLLREVGADTFASVCVQRMRKMQFKTGKYKSPR